MAEKQISRQNETRPSIRANCDVVQKDGEIVLRLEMPGVTREGLSVNIDGDQLEIHGMRDLSRRREGTYLVREIRDADYHQVYTIDETIDRGKIDAAMKNGVLTLTLGIKESQKPRRIEISAV